MPQETKQLFQFGDFRLDGNRGRLYRRGEVVPITPKALKILLVLVESHPRVVTKEELMEAVWPGTFVEEGNITFNIHTLRKVLSEGSEESKFIETVPRQGYRFTAQVTEEIATEPFRPDSAPRTHPGEPRRQKRPHQFHRSQPTNDVSP